MSITRQVLARLLLTKEALRENIFACLFSIHNAISLSRHEQVCLSVLRFERYFSHHVYVYPLAQLP